MCEILFPNWLGILANCLWVAWLVITHSFSIAYGNSLYLLRENRAITLLVAMAFTPLLVTCHYLSPNCCNFVSVSVYQLCAPDSLLFWACPFLDMVLLEPLSLQSSIAFKSAICCLSFGGGLHLIRKQFLLQLQYDITPCTTSQIDCGGLEFLFMPVCLSETRSAWCLAESSYNPSLAMMSCAMLTGGKVLKWVL